MIHPSTEALPDVEARTAVQDVRARFYVEMTERAGGMLLLAEVADLLGTDPVAIDIQRRKYQILAVPRGSEVYYPTAQFVDGQIICDLDILLHALRGVDPWEQLMLFTTPLEGFAESPQTSLQLLASGADTKTVDQLLGLFSSWAA